MEDKKKVAGLVILILVALGGAGYFISQNSGSPASLGEGVVDYKVQPPSDSAPASASPATNGGGAASAPPTEEGRGSGM